MITLGGDIKISGPKIHDGLMKESKIEFEHEKTMVEFRLEVNQAKKNGVKFEYLWLDFSGEKIAICCPDAKEENLMDYSFNIEIKGQNDGKVDLTLSIEQGRAIAEILSNCVQMFDLSEKLKSSKIA